MRFNSVALVAAVAILGHLSSHPGVAGLPITHGNDSKSVYNNRDGVIAQGSLKALGATLSEERMDLPTEQIEKAVESLHLDNLAEQVKAFARSMHGPKPEKRLQPSEHDVPREVDLLGDLLRHPDGLHQSLPRTVLHKELELMMSEHNVDVVVHRLVEMMESKNSIHHTYGYILLHFLVKQWGEQKLPIEDVLNLLQLSRGPDSYFGLSDYRKIRALNSYTRYYNSMMETHYTTIETLTKHYGVATLSRNLERSVLKRDCELDAVNLLEQLIRSWIKNKVSPNKVFAMLELNEKGDKVFIAEEFLTLERYAEQLKGEDMLSVLTEAFGGEGHFEELAAKASAELRHVKAKKYLHELFELWKVEKITPDNLLEYKFDTTQTTSSAKLVRDLYSDFFLDGPFRQDLAPR